MAMNRTEKMSFFINDKFRVYIFIIGVSNYSLHKHEDTEWVSTCNKKFKGAHVIYKC